MAGFDFARLVKPNSEDEYDFDPMHPKNRKPWLYGLHGGGVGPLRRHRTPEEHEYPGKAAGVMDAILPTGEEPEVNPLPMPAGQTSKGVPLLRRREDDLRSPYRQAVKEYRGLQEKAQGIPERTKPGIWRTIAAVGFGGLSNWGQPGTGGQVARNVLYAPRQQAQEEIDRQLKAARERIDLAAQGIGLERGAAQEERAAAREERQQAAFENEQTLRELEIELKQKQLSGQLTQQEVIEQRTEWAKQYLSHRSKAEQNEYALLGKLPAASQIGSYIDWADQEAQREGLQPGTQEYVDRVQELRRGFWPPRQPSAGTERQRTVNRLAREALKNAGNDPQAAVDDILQSVDQGLVDPALMDDLIRAIRLLSGGKSREGFSSEEFTR